MGAIPDSIGQRLDAILRRVERLEVARRLESASIGAGGMRVVDGGQIEVVDNSDVVRVRITPTGISVFDAEGFERWSDETAWAGHTEPDSVLPGFTFVSSTSWTSIDTWTWRDYASYAQVAGMISPPPPGDEGALRLRTVDPFGGEVVAEVSGLEMGASGRDYPQTIGGSLPLPFGISYHEVELQARMVVGGGPMGVQPMAASWSQ